METIEDADAVIAALRVACRDAGTTRHWAQSNGFNSACVDAVLCGRKRVSVRLASAIGFRRVVRWEREEIKP